MASEHDSDNSRTRTDCSPSTLFEALSRRQRRLILRYLADTEGPVFLDELAAQLDAHGDDQHDRTLLAGTLMSHHLPKLAEADLVCFDRDTHIVEEGPAAAHTARHLALVDDWEDA